MQCQHCGRPIANPTAICSVCDRELSTSSYLDAGTPVGSGRYRCAACSGFFDHWTTALLPRNARWYTPQEQVPTCPLCGDALQWKRDAEPAQLSARLQGIAMGMTCALWLSTPDLLLQEVKEHLGKWFIAFIPMLLIAMLLIAVRPSLRGPGQGAGHFVPMHPPQVGQPQFWAATIIGVAIAASVRTAPQAAQFPLWCAWLGLAAAGCLAAVLWRRSVERHRRLQTPDPAAPSHSRLS